MVSWDQSGNGSQKSARGNSLKKPAKSHSRPSLLIVFLRFVFVSPLSDISPTVAHCYYQGYDTVIGENGIKLSGGQRQRLAIARSIVSQPPILILDEATSSIDVRGEGIVQEALDRVSKNRTTITIAHRLSTIKKADKIIVLRGGTTIEEGTHDDLLAKGGLYHDLVSNQQLVMDDDQPTIVAKDSVEASPLALSKTVSKVAAIDVEDTPRLDGQEAYKPRSLVSSVGLFLWEQRKYWILYVAVLISAAGCGGNRADPILAVALADDSLASCSGLLGSKLFVFTNGQHLQVHRTKAPEGTRLLGVDVLRPRSSDRSLLLRSRLGFQFNVHCSCSPPLLALLTLTPS